MNRPVLQCNHEAIDAIRILALLLLAVVGSRVMAGDGDPEVAFEWRESSPEGQEMDGTRLEEMRKSLAEHGTKGLLVIRNDKIVCEWYREGHGADKQHYTASMAKAVVGGVSLAVAMSDGLIALDDPAAGFVASWREDPRKSKITIRHLGSHTSGIEDAEADDLPHERLIGWKGDFWKRLDPPRRSLHSLPAMSRRCSSSRAKRCSTAIPALRC